jgi:hypothetical protein
VTEKTRHADELGSEIGRKPVDDLVTPLSPVSALGEHPADLPE